MSSHGSTKVDQALEANAALMRAHVHLRGGIQAGQGPASAAGITALYDAVLLGMRQYIARHEECASFVENTDPWDAAALYHALVRAGVFDDPLRFNRFSLIVERMLWQESFAFDIDSALAEGETMLLNLGVIPLHESPLPGDISLMQFDGPRADAERKV